MWLGSVEPFVHQCESQQLGSARLRLVVGTDGIGFGIGNGFGFGADDRVRVVKREGLTLIVEPGP